MSKRLQAPVLGRHRALASGGPDLTDSTFEA